MKKRSLFTELAEGIGNMQDAREGKITLRNFNVEANPAPDVTASDIVNLRESLHVSRAVFARFLRTNPRTIEGWEQGRTKPNAQAALLIKLVGRHPEMINEIATL